ncbi:MULTISPECIES: thiol-disulfide oxidoreductase DCC family protein [unclassified Salinicola]|uniref:thiol-disulfide oxidoreductase DCC family protein n=1 Tax=unclassified Salinicola TaxID=2634022 RepID=UPI001A8F03EE|nr:MULTISPECIES: DUF393 domain-containing protein [unclassified Salinicola]MCE3028457.1 DUF393 domain-containing protein [Salinicola sp. DM10]WIX33439.1 DUF393 domain-containing protein [Salinicola sp. JS01]
MAELTLFYDGACPLCVHEITHLRRLDRHRRIRFEDIHAADFSQRWPDVDPADASAILLGYYRGERLRGLDVTHRAWSLVGRGWLTAPLRWPLVKPLADRVYRWFAPRRYLLSGWLTGRQRCAPCDSGQCRIDDDAPPRA